MTTAPIPAAGTRFVLRGADLLDGSGAAARRADVLVDGGRIAAVGALPRIDDAAAVDVGGLTLAPGFIDLHTHSDAALLADGRGHSQLGQGVTTEVVGNCGFSCAPCAADGAHAMTLGPALPADARWRDFDGYLRALAGGGDGRGLGVNVAALVGHGALRTVVMPGEDRPADAKQTARMAALLDDCLEQGAIGLSSGLEYLPGRSADEAELTALCRCAARRGALYATHVRNRDADYERGLGEALRCARDAGARLQVSHMTPKYGAPAGAARHMREMVDAACADGVDAAFDVIPHEWGPTMVASVLPAWVFDGGAAACTARLRDPAARARIQAAPNPIWPLVRDRRWDHIVLFGGAAPDRWLGLTLAEVGRARGCDPFDAVLDLLADAGDARHTLSWVGRNFAASDTATLLADPKAGVISDAITLSAGGPLGGWRWSPSTWGWAARLLQRAQADPATLPLAEAVRRVTMLPAERLGLADRGRIAVGAWADLVAFEPARVADRSTLAAPEAAPEGFVHVWVNGAPALVHGRPAEARHGRVLTRGATGGGGR